MGGALVLLVTVTGSPARPALAATPTWSSCPTPLAGEQLTAPATSAKTVALTFDDGPGASTAQILSILEREGVRATFFNIGLQEAAWPADVRAEAAGGFLIADHTWSHPDLTTLPSRAQRQQMDSVGAEQRALVGSSPCQLRPPYGDADATTLAVARSLDLSTYLWDVDTEDWKAVGSSSEAWVSRIVGLAESEGGSLAHPVVLMHNQSAPMPATVAALPIVIDYFRSHGYRFVDLLGRSGPPGACAGTGPSTSPERVLPAHSALRAGQSLVSPDGQYDLTMEPDGALALHVGPQVTWTTPTAGHPNSVARVTATGRLVVIAPGGHALYSFGSGHPGDRLALGDDGGLRLLGRTALTVARAPLTRLAPGRALWPRWSLTTPSGACRLTMSSAGRLELVSRREGLLWRTNNSAVPGSHAVMTRSGQLVVVSPRGAVTWSSGTQSAGAVATVAPVGRALVTLGGRWLFSSP